MFTLLQIGAGLLASFIKKFHAIFLTILYAVGFFIVGRISQKNKENERELDNVYNDKKLQDQYDVTSIAVKREWLRNYSDEKVSPVAEAAAKNVRKPN